MYVTTQPTVFTEYNKTFYTFYLVFEVSRANIEIRKNSERPNEENKNYV